MRVLNLVVPILYKKLVDQFAAMVSGECGGGLFICIPAVFFWQNGNTGQFAGPSWRVSSVAARLGAWNSAWLHTLSGLQLVL